MGFSLKNLNKVEEAINQFDKCLEINKKNFEAYFNRGETRLMKYEKEDK